MRGDLGLEDGAVDEIGFDFLALDAIKTDISSGVDKLAQVDLVVFFRDEADNVCCFGHFEVELAVQSFVGLLWFLAEGTSWRLI